MTSSPAENTPAVQDKPKTIAGLITDMKSEIARALPRGMDADRIARLALTQVKKTPRLAECTAQSFAGALLTSSAIGLEPGVNGECYLVPYRDRKSGQTECQLIVGYQGIAKLYWQSPLAEYIDTQWVGENDEFDYMKGLNPYLQHRPKLGDRGKPILYYAVVRVKGSTTPIWDVFTAEQIQILRNGKVGTSGDIADPERWMERKGLALDTPIPTVSGWTTMAEVQVGDQVYDMDGVPAMVTVKSEIKNLPCFRVTFANGEQITCDHEHIWVAKIGRKSMQVVDIQEMYTAKQAGKPVTVPVAGSLTAEVEKLPIDPWLLGYWLGNGRRDAASVTCHADDVDEVVGKISATEYQVGSVRPDSRSKATCVTIKDGLKVALRENGILDTRRIPDEYRRAAEWQRWELLSGLMDSDGHIDKVRGRAHFYSTDEYLTDLVAELASSLGEVVYRKKRTLSGYGKTVVSYEAHWKPSEMPVTLDRKRANYRRRSIDPYRSVKSIEVVESVPTQCIAVDSPSRTYLAGRTMVPTHNTALKQVLKLAPKSTRLDKGMTSDESSGTELYRAMRRDVEIESAGGQPVLEGEVVTEPAS